MNTLTRAIVSHPIRARAQGTYRMTVSGMSIAALVIALLLSAFTVVYMKDLNRRLFIEYQTLQTEKTQTLVEWGKLLLEQSTWSTQSRIQHIAEAQLGMSVPNAKAVVLLGSHDANTAAR